MWKRKTQEDFKKDNESSNFDRGNLIFAFFLSVIAALLALHVIETFAGFVFCFVVFFVLSCIGIAMFNDPTFFVGFFFSGSATATTKNDICYKCLSVVQRTENKICKCGGRFEPLEDWKWVEDKESETEQTH